MERGERSVKTMLSLNKVMIIGNVGSDPEMRFTPNGHPVTSFRVGISWPSNVISI